MNMLTFYAAILDSAGISTDEQGFCSVRTYGDRPPMPAQVTINKKPKRLILPTEENLRQTDWSKLVVFHPLRENVVADESKVVEYLRKAYNMRINIVASALIEKALEMATSTALHPKLTTEQTRLMTILKNADEKTLKLWEKIMTKVSITESHKHIASLYLRKLGRINGEQFFVVGTWSFPLYQELKKALDSGGKEFMGFTTRRRDLPCLVALMEYLLPFVNEDTKIGTNNRECPFLDCLLRSVLKLSDELNRVCAVLHGKSPEECRNDPDLEAIYFDTSWLSRLDDLKPLEKEIFLVPVQEGNDSKTIKEAEMATIPQFNTLTQAAPGNSAQATPATPVAQPMAQPVAQPVATPQTNGIPFNQAVAATQALPVAQPVVQPVAQPVYQQPVPPANTGNGITMAQINRSLNPGWLMQNYQTPSFQARPTGPAMAYPVAGVAQPVYQQPVTQPGQLVQWGNPQQQFYAGITPPWNNGPGI